MKKSLLLVIVSVAVMLTLSFAVCATPAAASALMSEDSVLSGEVDLNVSELFIVERGYAVPVAEEDLPAEYLMDDNIGTELWHANLYLVEKDEYAFKAICSGAPDSNPTTGVPQQRLSATVIPKVSLSLVKTNKSAIEYNFANSLWSEIRPMSIMFDGSSVSVSFPTKTKVVSGIFFANSTKYFPPLIGRAKDAVTCKTTFFPTSPYFSLKLLSMIRKTLTVSIPFKIVL